MDDKKDNMELTSDMSKEEINIALKKFREMVKEFKETGSKPVNNENIDIVDVLIENEPLDDIESLDDLVSDDLDNTVIEETGNEPVIEDNNNEVEEHNLTGNKPVKGNNKKTSRLVIILVLLIILLITSFIILGGLKKINKKLGKYTVTFDTDGGSYVYKEKVSYDERIKEPIEPTKMGYEFVGWFLDDKPYDFNSSIKNDIKLVAHWKKYESKPVSGVRIDQESATIQINSDLSLIAFVEPSMAENTEVKWSSSNESVATVDSEGNVKALSEGNTIITVETIEGGFKATCNIKVAKKIINVTGIRFDKTTYTLSQGKTLEIKATVMPSNANNKGIIWKSSDSSIATVENGVVTGISEGTVTISATTKDGNYSAKAIIDIIDVPLTGLKINGSHSVGVKDKIQLEANYSPVNTTHRKVRWSSSNDKILKVDSNGLVTGVSAGKASITLTSEDGKYSDTYEIEVTNNKTVYNITLDKKEIALYLGESASLTATVYPKNALDKKVIWESSNDSIVKVVNGKVSAVGEGTAVIKAITNDGGFKSICNIIVKKKEPIYSVVITKGELNTFIVEKDGVSYSDYIAVLYNNIPLKEGNNINISDIDENIKNIKIKIDNNTMVDANVLYN